ncbi:rox3 family protein [Cladophialophora carrionii]|uniref:Mediator of RNA polymerase II transcription subunit 19 n=1 Tax=Cladophialophora carrionii TaxID=86049 RepID=A0A1C1D2Y9_9EURO|nr:rox3 family protein [Cladophialophora carrionii]
MFLSSRPTTIPPSPTSPPESALKRRRLSDNLPQSPLSPSFMSVATKSYVSSYGNTHNPDEATARSTPSSPRGSAARSQPPSRPTHSLPTPAHSVAGTNSGFDLVDDADQHRDKRQRRDSGREDQADQMEVEPITHATNHDRNDMMEVEGEDRVADGVSAAHLMVDEKTLEQLQEDMGDAFLLCRSKVERQRPDPQQHLLALYGLGPLLHSVARTDPRTGEKINKLRKSYEGQIKGFNLSGRNKPVKGERNVEEDQPGPLRRMAGSSMWGLQPEEQWNAEHAKSKIEVTPDFRAKLKQAVQMQPGTVRNNGHWEDVLGFEKPNARPPPATQPQSQPSIPRQLPNGVMRPAPQQNADAKRQTRGKKRSYGDDSFVGYGEGYSDPEDGDGDEYGQRKRKKFTGTDY